MAVRDEKSGEWRQRKEGIKPLYEAKTQPEPRWQAWKEVGGEKKMRGKNLLKQHGWTVKYRPIYGQSLRLPLYLFIYLFVFHMTSIVRGIRDYFTAYTIGHLLPIMFVQLEINLKIAQTAQQTTVLTILGHMHHAHLLSFSHFILTGRGEKWPHPFVPFWVFFCCFFAVACL